MKQITAFTEASVFIGDGRILENSSVLIEDGRIVKVAEDLFDLPPETRRISMEGKFLLPGLIDCHVHLCLNGSTDPVGTAMGQNKYFLAFQAAESARRTIMAGVTTVRDLGSVDEITFGLREAVATGVAVGPRVVSAGRLICMTGGHGWPFGRQADGPHEVRKAAREQILAGADVIKIMATGGVMTPGVQPGSPQFTEEEMRAAIEEAHKAGRKTATHAMGVQGVLNALRAGIDSIEHGCYLDDEAISIMAENQVFFVPTLSPLLNIERHGTEAGIPAYMVEKTIGVKQAHLESIRKARKAGVPFGIGTDAGTPFNFHGRNAQELVYSVEHGFSPTEALMNATSNAAKCLGLESDLGLIEEGKLADLIVVDGNPLDDISLLTRQESIKLVMQGGRIIRED